MIRRILHIILGAATALVAFTLLPLVNGGIRHLAKQETLAIVAGVTIGTGETIDFL